MLDLLHQNSFPNTVAVIMDACFVAAGVEEKGEQRGQHIKGYLLLWGKEYRKMYLEQQTHTPHPQRKQSEPDLLSAWPFAASWALFEKKTEADRIIVRLIN